MRWLAAAIPVFGGCVAAVEFNAFDGNVLALTTQRDITYDNFLAVAATP
jgi:hypothetical protein